MEKITTGQRLRQIMSDRNLKQVDILRMSEPFQKQLGIKLGKSTLSQYVNDIQSPDQNKLYLLSRTLDVSEPWLMGFDVPKTRISITERESSLHNMRSKLLDTFDKLNDAHQQKVVDYSSKQLKKQIYEENHKATIIHINEINPTFEEKMHYEIPFKGSVSAGTGEWMDDEMHEMITLDHEPPASADFALKVNGDSMEPFFENGQIIFVKSIEDPSQVFSNQFVIADLNGDAYVKKIVFEQVGCRLVSLNKKYPDKVVTENDAFYVRGTVVFE